MNEFKLSLVKTLREAYDRLNKHKDEGAQKMKEYYDLRQKDVSFQIDDLVMLYMPAPNAGLSAKLVGQWKGPYTVTAKIDAVTYRVLVKETRRVYPVAAHVKRLRPYKPWMQVAPKEITTQTPSPDQLDAATCQPSPHFCS